MARPLILACLPKGLPPAEFLEKIYEPEMLSLERGVQFQSEKYLIGCVGVTGTLFALCLVELIFFLICSGFRGATPDTERFRWHTEERIETFNARAKFLERDSLTRGGKEKSP